LHGPGVTLYACAEKCKNLISIFSAGIIKTVY